MSHTDSHDSLHNPEVAHEHSDVNVRAIIGFAVALTVVTVSIFVLMWGLFRVLERQAAANDPPVSPLARPAAEMPASTGESPFFGEAPGPRLITNEPSVLRKQRMMEAEVLGSYGWVDEKAGIARMPISEAKKLILQRGLPARADGAADARLGTHRAAFGESSSGRTIPTGRKKEEATKDDATKDDAPKAPAPPKGHGQ